MDVSYLQTKLEFCLIDTSILLSRCKMLEQSSRSAPAYNDKRYFPFYFALGTQVQPKKVIQIGCKLGLIGASFLQGCKTVESWTGMDQAVGSPPVSIIQSNLKMFGPKHVEHHLINGDLPDLDEKFDLAFLTEKYDGEQMSEYMDYLWKHLRPEGLLAVDYIQEDGAKAFNSFCRVKNREPICFDTRYGLGILTR